MDRTDTVAIPLESDIDDLVLREAQRTTAMQVRNVTFGLFIIILITMISLQDRVPFAYTAAWAVPLVMAMAVRAAIARRMLREFDAGDVPAERVRLWETRMRVSCMVNQTFAGSTVWFTSTSTSADDRAVLFVTVLSALFAIGTINNLAADYKSVIASIPLLMGQLIFYWAAQGTEGLSLALALIVVTALMIRFARNHSRIFRESVAMRAQKDALLAEQEVLAANQKTMLTQVRAALDEAEAANRAKAQFLAAASHDLRQPLHAVSLLSDTLALHELPEPARAVVDQQRLAINALSNMFTNLLDLSRFESGDIQPRWTDVSIRQLFAQLDIEFSPQCAERGLDWRVHAIDGAVTSDPVHLIRLLRNLLSNAVHYTSTGHVELGAAIDGDRTRIWVNDSGPGIAPEHQEEVFQPFVQLGNKARNRERGFGLGLAIARHLGNILGSALFLRSAPGEGTRFTLFARTAHTAPQFPATPADGSRTAQVAARMTIWVVEDDEFVRTAFSHQFKALGLAHRLAASPAEFRALMVHEPIPDAVIFDDMLGEEESGLDLAIELSSGSPETRILIVTANTQKARLQVIENSGFSWMHKPLTTQQMLHWLESGNAMAAEGTAGAVWPSVKGDGLRTPAPADACAPATRH